MFLQPALFYFKNVINNIICSTACCQFLCLWPLGGNTSIFPWIFLACTAWDKEDMQNESIMCIFKYWNSMVWRFNDIFGKGPSMGAVKCWWKQRWGFFHPWSWAADKPCGWKNHALYRSALSMLNGGWCSNSITLSCTLQVYDAVTTLRPFSSVIVPLHALPSLCLWRSLSNSAVLASR